MKFYIFILLLLPYCSFSQYNPIPITKIEETILNEILKDTTSDLTKDFSINFSFGIGNQKEIFYPILVKNKNKTYFIISGTNRVYQCKKENSKLGFKIIRLDSTKFYGDNFNMIPFYRKDTLFQFGGYGFWQNRDFFSYYRPLSKDWEFYQSEAGIQSIYSINYYDKEKDHFFLIGRYHQDSHKSLVTDYIDSTYCFDFKSRTWKNQGKIANIIFKPPIDINTFWSNENGFFFMRLNLIYFMDIPKNKYYTLKKEYQDKFTSFSQKIGIAGNNNILIGLKDSLLWIWGTQNHYSINKFKLSIDHFDFKNPQQIYIPINNNVEFNSNNIPFKKYSIYTVLLILLSSSILLFKKKYSNNPNIKPSQKQNELFNQIRFMYSQLNQIEKDLFTEIISASLIGNKLDNNDINKILGVQNKQPMIQKTRRSLTITKINDLYMNLTGSKSAIIKRSQDEQDKRSFNYFIITKDALEIADILKKINEQNV